MDKEQLKIWLSTDQYVIVQMPNEIFDDFSKADFKNFNHKCFAYAYYYLCSYLYRNALYGSNPEQYSQQNIIQTFVSNKSIVSYITKTNGILDQIGYTKSTTNYPINYYMDNGILEFTMIKDYRKKMSSDLSHSPRLTIKEPVKAFVRINEEDCTGTFYSYQNTHAIDIEEFITIISDKELGHVGLFIYAYIKMMCDRHKNKFQITNSELGRIVGCSERTIQNYTQRLEELKLIRSIRKGYEGKLLSKMYSII